MKLKLVFGMLLLFIFYLFNLNLMHVLTMVVIVCVVLCFYHLIYLVEDECNQIG